MVRRFAQEGEALAILARGSDGLTATVAEARSLGGEAIGIATDVAHADQVEAAAQQAERELGPIDVWINNAMTTVVAPFHEMAEEEYRRVTDVCYHGYVWGTQAALARMRPRRRGMIIQVGSALAYRSIPLQSAYCGAKHAIHGFTDSIRSELLHDRIPIDLCMVQLPAVNTPQFGWCVNKMPSMPQPVPPIFQPEIIAEAIHRVSLHPRREVFLGWPSIKAILGNEVAPGYADRYLAHEGYVGQLTDKPNRHHAFNLFEPVAGDHGARGAFDDRARSKDFIAAASTALGGVGIRMVVAASAFATVTAVVCGALAVWRER